MTSLKDRYRYLLYLPASFCDLLIRHLSIVLLQNTGVFVVVPSRYNPQVKRGDYNVPSALICELNGWQGGSSVNDAVGALSERL